MAPTSEDKPKSLGVGRRADEVDEVDENKKTEAENFDAEIFDAETDAETNDERFRSASRSSTPDTVIYNPVPPVPTVSNSTVSNSQLIYRRSRSNTIDFADLPSLANPNRVNLRRDLPKTRKRGKALTESDRPCRYSVCDPPEYLDANLVGFNLVDPTLVNPDLKLLPPTQSSKLGDTKKSRARVSIPQSLLEAARRYRLEHPLHGPRPQFPELDLHQEPPSPTKFACGPFRPTKKQPPQTPPKFKTRVVQSPSSPGSPKFKIRGANRTSTMNYQNYLDSPQAGPSPGPRQAPFPSQGAGHTNGVNGGAVAMPGMMGGLPTPAGHQSDLNHIYNMVEALSNELAESRARTERIVAATGLIRQRALELNMTPDEIIAGVANELNESSKNLEEENSRLRHALEHATHEEAAYKDLCNEYATAMTNWLELAHAYKLRTGLDMCAWHRSYRDQLAAERAENLELRCQIADMQASAARGMEHLRLFRRGWDRSDLVLELQTEIISLRQQCRGWKRVAMPELPSDDSEFSSDSDIIDPEEKKRLARLEEEKELKEEIAARHAADEQGEGEGESSTDGATAALATALEASNLTEGAAGAESTL